MLTVTSFFNWCLKDPWFDWLHRLSELIVQIDEALDSIGAEKPATEEDARALISRARSLLTPAEEGTQFQKNYFLALQQSPDVVLLHSEMLKLLNERKDVSGIRVECPTHFLVCRWGAHASSRALLVD